MNDGKLTTFRRQMKGYRVSSIALIFLATACIVPRNALQLAQPSSSQQAMRVAFVAAQKSRKGFYIFQIHADGSSLGLITRDHNLTQKWVCCPAWSSDGKELAFVLSNSMVFQGSNTGIFVKSLAPETVRVVFGDDKTCLKDPAWSPDSKHLVFARGRKASILTGRSLPCANEQLFTINLDGSGLRQLTYSDIDFSGRPAWSPDGSTIAFVSGPNREGFNKADIYLMDSDGSNPRQLTSGAAKEVNGDPAWSPDGKEIAFYSNRDGNFDLYIMRRDGSNVRQVTHGIPNGVRHPSWSPDGQQIVFGTGRGSPIYIADPNSTNRRVLTSAGWHPTFGKVPEP